MPVACRQCVPLLRGNQLRATSQDRESALCGQRSSRPWIGPNLVKVYQQELSAAITGGVVLCAHFKLSFAPPV